MRAPAICIGNSSPFETHCWVIHIDQPRILARAEPTQDDGVHLRLVTAGNFSEEECRRLLGDMVAVWRHGVAGKRSGPWTWSYWPPITAPTFLVLDGFFPDGSDFVGVLEAGAGTLWGIDHGSDGVVRLDRLTEVTHSSIFQSQQDQALEFYEGYLKAERRATAKAKV